MEMLCLADFLLIAESISGIEAKRLERMPGMTRAESALAAPRAGFGDVELYPALPAKAAILCSRIVRNHPLPDGNKRVAYICMIEFIRRNGREWAPEASTDERAAAIEQLAAGALSESDFVAWVQRQIV
jgi:death-on-curing protein